MNTTREKFTACALIKDGGSAAPTVAIEFDSGAIAVVRLIDPPTVRVARALVVVAEFSVADAVALARRILHAAADAEALEQQRKASDR